MFWGPPQMLSASGWTRKINPLPDITMCKGGRCRVRNRCYRYMAVPKSDMQSYFSRVPSKKPCPYRIKVRIVDGMFVFPEER